MKYSAIIFLLMTYCFTSCNSKKKAHTTLHTIAPNSYTFNNSKPFYSHLKGKLGSKSISMDMVYNAFLNSFEASFQFDDEADPHLLKGTIESNHIVLKHFPKGSKKFDELFIGSFQKNKSFSGQWLNADSSMIEEFNLVEMNNTSLISIEMQTYDTAKTYTDILKNDYTIDFHYTIPVCSDEKINHLIQQKMIQNDAFLQEASTTKDLIIQKTNLRYATFLAELKELSLSNHDSCYDASLSVTRGMYTHIIRNDKDFFILKLTEFTSHPTKYISIINYDKKLKKEITSIDLIKQYGKDNLLASLNKQIKLSYKIKEEDDFTSKTDEMFMVDKVEEIPENFYLSNTGITFLFNDNELKAYAAEAEYIFVPFENLKN
ncbi:MAG: RsiV family protein [Bacteroidota bacterium]